MRDDLQEEEGILFLIKYLLLLPTSPVTALLQCSQKQKHPFKIFLYIYEIYTWGSSFRKDPIHRKFVFIRSVKIHLAFNVAMPGIYLSACSKNYELSSYVPHIWFLSITLCIFKVQLKFSPQYATNTSKTIAWRCLVVILCLWTGSSGLCFGEDYIKLPKTHPERNSGEYLIAYKSIFCDVSVKGEYLHQNNSCISRNRVPEDI